MARNLFLLLWILGASAFAQKDTLRFVTHFNGTGTFNKTNTNSSYLLSNTLRFSLENKTIKSNFLNRWLYGQQDEKLINNDFSSLFDCNLYKTFPHFNYWTLLSYSTLYSLKINHQVQAGAGIAYNIIHAKRWQLNLSEGILYDYSDIQLMDTVREIYQTPRNSFRIQLKLFPGERINFTSFTFFQHSFEYGNDFIIRSESNLNCRIKRWLTLTMKLTYNRISRTQKENLFATYGLTIEIKK